jgi:Leucine-rich repeat (LRR) protein
MVTIRELFLRKNNISDIQELQYLSGLQHLHVLWLAENPVTATPNCE